MSPTSATEALDLPCYIAGVPVKDGERLEIRNPYNNHIVGTVVLATRAHTEAAIREALTGRAALTRFQRSEILDRARQLLESRREEFAQLITAESGLCIRETRYETGRASDVLRLAAMEALRDDGQVFSCDISPQGKARKIFTLREPLALVAAITPFNHPLNQVVHKLALAVAVGAPVILKPATATPLTAIRFVELLYEAGVPPRSLSVLLGKTEEVAEVLVRDPRVELVTFTGGETVGKKIAQTAGYKRLVLELGGNDPLIVLSDADLELAVNLAAEGAFRNSGQRCTAVKRILVEQGILDQFTARFVEKAREYTCGDPADPETRVGTVISEAAAIHLESVVKKAEAAGAKILFGGQRRGALLSPTVIAYVPRDAEMVVYKSFGPLAPVLVVRDLDDAVQVANSTAYGLSAGVVTRDLNRAIELVKRLKTGTININEVPGYRTENSPFGGIKDSGLGIKEGVIEALKCMTTVKTFSLPW
jgi:putative phosphonoacetaldehyde dehydrogenase